MVTAGETAGRRSAQTKIYGKGKLGITVIKITLNDLKFCLWLIGSINSMLRILIIPLLLV